MACSHRFNVSFNTESDDVQLRGFLADIDEDIEIPIEISTSDASFLYLGEMFAYLGPRTDRGSHKYNITLVSGAGVLTVQEPNTRVLESGDMWSNKIVLGVGPSSSLITRTGAMNLIRTSSTTGYFDLFGSQSDFESSCIPNSMIRIPFSRRYEQSGTIVGKFRLVLSNAYIPASRPGPVRISSPVGLSAGHKLLSLPFEIVSIIERIFIAQGSVPTGFGAYEFNECPERLDFLPSVGLSFFEDDHRTTLGELILSGPDYIKRLPGGRCMFRFRATGPGVRSLYFRPWRIPGVNLCINGREMLICDSRVLP